MGFQQRMMNMMMGRKSPEDMTKMMGEMIPQMMEKIGSEGMSKMMGEMMPQMMSKMGHEEIERMMLDMMPSMMDTCFSEMDRERRQFILTHCRGMLDKVEEKYMGPAVT